MQTAFTANIAVSHKTGMAKPQRTSRHIITAVKGADKDASFSPAQGAAVAGLAALLLSVEAAPALAAAPAVSGQGAVLEQLLAEQKSGLVKFKPVKSATKVDTVAVYGKNKPIAAPKPAAKKAAPAKAKPAAKPAASKVTSKPLKFAAKAVSGAQGAAPAGIELPVPKGAISKPAAAPAAAKKAPAAPKPKPAAAIKKETPKPKPAAAVKKETPKPKPAASKAAPAAAAAAAAGAAATAVKAAVAPVPVPKPAAKPAAAVVKSVAKTPAKPASAPSLSDPALQAGAVVVAELAGLAAASAVVGGITKPSKA